MDFPVDRMPVPPILTPFSPESLGMMIVSRLPLSALGLENAASGTWVTGSLAFFYPFTLTDWGTARQLLLWVGATSSGNFDIGIYDSQKNLIVSSGSTAMSGTVNTVQEINITDTVVGPGDYLLGVVVDNTTATVFRAATSADELTVPTVPFYSQSSAFPLPDPCVPVTTAAASPPIVVCGIQFASVF